jgi:mxaJ protein
MSRVSGRLALPRLTVAIVVAGLFAIAVAAAAAPRPTLRVCADPNNLPFSHQSGEGLEDALARLIARDMGARVETTWWAQRRGFLRNTLNAGSCDVVMGAPTDLERVLTTRPWYRSAYVFVTRAGVAPIRSFDDPALRGLRVGVHLVGDDGWNTPPAHALAARGIIDNVRGYTVYGDYADDSPVLDLLRALDRGEIDVAVAWGPLAGFYAKRAKTPLTLTPVDHEREGAMRFAFDISVAVRKDDRELRDRIDQILEKRQREVGALLARFGVPVLPPAPPIGKATP